MAKQKYATRLVGEILQNHLENSNDALTVAYCKHLSEVEMSRDLPAMAVEIDEDLLFKKLFPNTELGVDLKLLTLKPGRMAVGDTIAATVTRDGEDHFTILQMAHEKLRNLTSRLKPKVKRNPIVLPGTYINVHEADDGTRYPTFNRPEYTDDFTFYDLCLGAAQELYLIGSLGKKMHKGK